MPHLRKRYVEDRLRKTLSFSTVTGLLGQRQVGKTTLLEGLAKTYTTLDKESDLLEAEENPEVFIANRESPFAIDESQLCPRLFPAIKEAVRLNKKPGQFLLSGSVRFTSRELIRESLTGRIVNNEVLPFTIREAHALPISQVLTQISKVKSQKDLVAFLTPEKKIGSASVFENYLVTGGLPGIAFYRDASIRIQKFESHLDTLLNRDIRLVIKTSLPYTSLRALLKFLAIHQGKSFDLKEAGEYSQISSVTLKKILYAFEALFLIRPITHLGPEKKTCYFLEDQGTATWLTGLTQDKAQDILRGIYANLRQEFFYDPSNTGSIHHYRTKHGVNIPLVFQHLGGLLGIIPCSDSYPPPKTMGSALAFLKANPRARVIVAYNHADAVYKSERLYFVPYYWLV